MNIDRQTAASRQLDTSTKDYNYTHQQNITTLIKTRFRKTSRQKLLVSVFLVS